MSDVVWQQTLDDGAFTLLVTRVDDTDMAVLQVIDNETEQVIYERNHMVLAYGAVFGPDQDDVAHWQEITVEAVDNYKGAKE